MKGAGGGFGRLQVVISMDFLVFAMKEDSPLLQRRCFLSSYSEAMKSIRKAKYLQVDK